MSTSAPTQNPLPLPRLAGQTLEIFSKPLRAGVLAELASGVQLRADLVEALGAADSTLNAALKELEEERLIRRQRIRDFPAHTTISLAPGPGQDLICPLNQVSRWLARAGLKPLQAQDRKTSRLAAHLAWSWHHHLIDALSGTEGNRV
jgi:DNA-binding HxlR family transcriptional regulator